MSDEPIREIKPVVVPLQFFVTGPLVSAFVAIFPGFFVFVISNIILGISRGLSFEGPNPTFGIIAWALSFAFVMYLCYLHSFVEPGRITYKVFDDRIEYEEGLFNRHRRTVIFDQVIDVHLTEGMLQQTKGAGGVTLVTQQLVSSGDGQLSNRRFTLRNVPDPKETYDLICSLGLKN